MACTVIGDNERACFACNTTDVAFGPLHYSRPGGDGHAVKEMYQFKKWLGEDPRGYEVDELRSLYREWTRVKDDD